MRYIATLNLLINRLYIPFISPSSGSHIPYCTAPSTPGLSLDSAKVMLRIVYDKKGRAGVFLMILLESSAFCKAVEESRFEREFS
jgi:hypothetical protein